MPGGGIISLKGSLVDIKLLGANIGGKVHLSGGRCGEKFDLTGTVKGLILVINLARIRGSEMHRRRHHVRRLIGSLALVSIMVALPVAADEYKSFRDCVQETGDGTKCTDKLPKNDRFKRLLDYSNQITVPIRDFTPPSFWGHGGLNTTTAASVLLQQQL